MKKIKTKIIVYPVAWSNGKVLKYRAHMECNNGVLIYVDPKSTEDAAIKDLDAEISKYNDATDTYMLQKIRSAIEIDNKSVDKGVSEKSDLIQFI